MTARRVAGGPDVLASRWTYPLRIAVAACSVVFFVGTTLHNVVVVDEDLIEVMMKHADVVDPTAEAAGFLTGFRVIGAGYMAGNAVGILAFWIRPAWLYWFVLLVNATQALGLVMIPPSMWTAVVTRHGLIGTLPSAVTDGGAALLTVTMLSVLVIFRRTWALRTPPARS